MTDRVRVLAPPIYAGRTGVVKQVAYATRVWPIFVEFDKGAPKYGGFKTDELEVLVANR